MAIILRLSYRETSHFVWTRYFTHFDFSYNDSDEMKQRKFHRLSISYVNMIFHLMHLKFHLIPCVNI